jgi:pimeloyl-ACP methyl ester carboxylesterase
LLTTDHQPWGFDLSEITVPVLLCQGSEDKMVPFSHSRWLAAHLPNSKGLKVNLREGEGHISILAKETEVMVEGVIEVLRQRDV